MKNAKTILGLVMTAALTIGCLAGCGAKTEAPAAPDDSSAPAAESSFDTSSAIGVISREDGSGTRGAFVELFGVEKKNDAGEKVDYTVTSAAVTNSTSVMMTTVSGDLYSIGYISLGSMNDTIKAVEIDGAAASVENIENGSYKVSRPFNIVLNGALSAEAQDFVDYIMSADGQKVIADAGYIPVSDAPAYSGSAGSGKIVVSGSSSVTPVMEKLKEAYLAINPDVTVEVQQSDSTTGITNALDGVCDIGMASRDLKDEEAAQGLTATVIAMDGIAVIVNNDSPVQGLTSEQVRQIFTGEATVWADVIG